MKCWRGVGEYCWVKGVERDEVQSRFERTRVWRRKKRDGEKSRKWAHKGSSLALSRNLIFSLWMEQWEKRKETWHTSFTVRVTQTLVYILVRTFRGSMHFGCFYFYFYFSFCYKYLKHLRYPDTPNQKKKKLVTAKAGYCFDIMLPVTWTKKLHLNTSWRLQLMAS